MSDQIPQVNAADEELSVEELEEVAGGGIEGQEAEDANGNCGNCGCTVNP